MRRLYSTFASGLPGAGLLLMRLVVGAVLLASTGPTLWSDTSFHITVTGVFLVVSALLLVAGLWTPVAGAIAAMIEISQILSLDQNAVVGLLTATMAAALALLGPGRWSVDARLFGWKRIEPSPPRRQAGEVGLPDRPQGR